MTGGPSMAYQSGCDNLACMTTNHGALSEPFKTTNQVGPDWAVYDYSPEWGKVRRKGH